MVLQLVILGEGRGDLVTDHEDKYEIQEGAYQGFTRDNWKVLRMSLSASAWLSLVIVLCLWGYEAIKTREQAFVYLNFLGIAQRC